MTIIPETIKKRDGRLVAWNRDKIFAAVFAAVKAVGGDDSEPSRVIARQVEFEVGNRMTREPSWIPSVEEVQDLVESVLIKAGHDKVARAYIKYRLQRSRARDIRGAVVSAQRLINSYMKDENWRTRENANLGHNFAGMVLHTVQEVFKTFTLSEIYPNKVRDAHLEGRMHIHDLGFGMVGYCAGWDLPQLLTSGLGADGQVTSAAPRHLGSALQIAVNALGVLQNEWAGAQAYSSFDTYMAPFVRDEALRVASMINGDIAEKAYRSRLQGTAVVKDLVNRVLSDPESRRMIHDAVKQEVQQFIFAINVTSRWGSQAPFTNITLDLTVPRDMQSEAAILDGRRIDTAYGDYQAEMDLFNDCFLEVLSDGDSQGRVFPFPIPTYNVTRDFWNHPLVPKIMQLAGRYGTPYFANFMHPDVDMRPEDARSMCCRLRLDKRELLKRGGGLFGSAGLTGSLGVVTINLPRLAWTTRGKGETAFFKALGDVMKIAREALLVKKDLLEKVLASGFLPYTQRYLPSFDRHFMTIGLVGAAEACLNFYGVDILQPKGKSFAESILRFMRGVIADWQEEDGQLYNLEATPAEGAATRLARIDVRDFSAASAHQGEGEGVYYSNSTMPPPAAQNDIWALLEHQKDLQTLYTGGTVVHLFLGATETDWRTIQDLLMGVFENYPVPYVSVTPTYSVCPEHGYFSGEHWKCPSCGQPCEVYSRVVGYYRPVSRWNVGKQQEWEDRRFHDPRKINSRNKQAA